MYDNFDCPMIRMQYVLHSLEDTVVTRTSRHKNPTEYIIVNSFISTIDIQKINSFSSLSSIRVLN